MIISCSANSLLLNSKLTPTQKPLDRNSCLLLLTWTFENKYSFPWQTIRRTRERDRFLHSKEEYIKKESMRIIENMARNEEQKFYLYTLSVVCCIWGLRHVIVEQKCAHMFILIVFIHFSEHYCAFRCIK